MGSNSKASELLFKMNEQTEVDEVGTKKSEDANAKSRTPRHRGRHFHRQNAQNFSPAPLSLTLPILSARYQHRADAVTDAETSSHYRFSSSSSISGSHNIQDGRQRELDQAHLIHRKKKKKGTSSILLTLSENCRKHQMTGKQYHSKDCAPIANWDDLPKFCQCALEVLRRILPKVEETIHESVTLKTDDLQHLCDFYKDVVEGGFCPHALHLFDLGRGAVEIVPRVFKLFQCLSSESVIKNLILNLSSTSDAQHNLSLPCSAWFKSCQTIILLLDCVQDSQIRLAFIKDLIFLISDLSVVAESNAFGEKVELRGEIEVDLFEQTLKTTCIDGGNNDNGVDVSIDRHWTITISSMKSLSALQAGAYFILNEFLKKCKSRRLMPSDHHQYELDESKSVLFSDLYYAWAYYPDGKEPILELLEMLLSSGRQTLLSRRSSESEIASLSNLIRIGAATSLSNMLSDWNRAGAPSLDLLQQATLLVAQGAATEIQLHQLEKYVVSIELDALLDILSDLVHTVSFVLPSLPTGSSSQAFSIHRGFFMILFDAIGHFLNDEAVNKLHSSTLSNFPALLRLKLSIVRGLSMSVVGIGSLTERDLNEKNGWRSTDLSFNSAWPAGHIFPLVMKKNIKSLFGLLHLPDMSEHCITCLSYLLFPERLKNSDQITELDRICRMAFQEEENSANNTDEETNLVDGNISVTSGLKRRHSFPHSASIAKRQRMIRIDCEEMESFTELVSLALNCEKSIGKAFSAGNETKFQDLNVATITDFQLISSAAILLLCSPNHLHVSSDDVFHFNKLLQTLLDTTKLVVNSVSKLVHENEGSENSVWFNLVGVVVANGIRMSEAVENIHLTLENKELVTFHVSMAKNLLVEMLFKDMKIGEHIKLPAFCNEAVISFVIRHCRSKQVSFPSTERVFDDMVIMIVYNLGSFTINWLNPLATTAVNNNRTTLSQTLRVLSLHLEQPCLDAIDVESNPKQIANAIFIGIRKSMANSPARILLLRLIELFVLNFSVDEIRRLTYTQSLPIIKKESEYLFKNEILQFIASACCIDSDDLVRTFATRFCQRLMASNNWKTLIAWLATDNEWENLEQSRDETTREPIFSQVISRFFHSIDTMLHKYCSIPQSQLSYTVGTVDKSPCDATGDKSTDMVPAFRASTARLLLGLCSEADHQTFCSKLIFEQALIRVVRIWAGIDKTKFRDSAGVCFAELSRFSYSSDIYAALGETYKVSLAPALFRDILIPNSSVLQEDSQTDIHASTTNEKDRQFRLLSFFIKCFLCRKKNVSRKTNVHDIGVLNVHDVEGFLELYLPFVVSQLVLEKDYDALRLTTQFKLDVLRQKRDERKVSKRGQSDPHIICMKKLCMIEAASCSKHFPGTLTVDVEDQTRKLCLAPEFTERIVPLIFSQASRSQLNFFIKIVLRDSISLKTIINSREQLILKALVFELGHDSNNSMAAVYAIKAAAMMRIHDFDNPTSSVPKDTKLKVELDRNEQKAVNDWISSHFRYLLVNVVQARWNTKTTKERTDVLRCLYRILDFLHAAESPQYLPQMMATISSAIGVASSESEEDRSQLRLLAVNVLFKFVKLVAIRSWETIGQNLTNIVVSLFPLITDDRSGSSCSSDLLVNECKSCVVKFLEWMTKDKLGKNLAEYFAEIPFLPPSPLLDSFKIALRTIGVDFDHLSVSTSQSTQQDGAQKASMTSDGDSTVAEMKNVAENEKMQAALRRRLDMIRPLLGNENASVRQAVLSHLSALLRSNRSLFHALVENESSASMKRYLTISYSQTAGVSRGSVTEIVEILLSRCVKEENPNAQILVGSCLGEIGAISAHRLEHLNPVDASAEGMLNSIKPPWTLALAEYELLLLSNHLPVALRAAATANDQNLIGFTIQELFSIIDISPNEGKARQRQQVNSTKQPMSTWLVGKLQEANVFDIVEPFWLTEFQDNDEKQFAKRSPPFFPSAPSFYSWLSTWCRYMVHRSHERRKTKWSKLFYACRGALRTQAGLGVTEFLLPLLVLDCLCFGNGHDEKVLLHEIVQPLTFDNTDNSRMNRTERQKAVNIIFNVIDLLQQWSETETENRHKATRRNLFTEVSNQKGTTSDSDEWPVEESVMRIDDMIKEISYEFRSNAAANVGMFAYSLRLLEMNSRSLVASDVFDGTSTTPSSQSRSRAAGICVQQQLSFMKDVLAKLDDYESLIALGDDDFWSNPDTRVKDSIRKNESLGNWEAALHDYDQLTIIDNSEQQQLGSLRCLLELGHFESVLQQVNGIIKQEQGAENEKVGDVNRAVPIAVEAAWRLGKWDRIESLLEFDSNKPSQSYSCHDAYQMCLGSIMLHASSRNISMLHTSLKQARRVILDDLSSVSRESYARAYSHIVKLHAIREIEDVAEFLCSNRPGSLEEIVSDQNLAWESRLDFVSPAEASDVINTRVALARLAKDRAYESLLFLNMGSRARKSGFHGIAANAFAQSESVLSNVSSAKKALLVNSLQHQFAKLKHDCGESSVALRILEGKVGGTWSSFGSNEQKGASDVGLSLACNDGNQDEEHKKINDLVLRSLLQSTRWMIEGGLKGCNEIVAQFKNIHNAAPKWEKGHFHYAKYIDSVLRTRVMELEKRSIERFSGSDEDFLRSRVISSDRTCQKYLLVAMKHYAHALSLDMKHLYQALPRLLSLWFEFTAIKISETDDTLTQADTNARSLLPSNQEEANAFMARTFKEIPAHAFYTAMPQLISRLIHEDSETSLVVRGILKRVLVKFPSQAMWALAWIRLSRDGERRQIGNNIFREAEKALSKESNQTLYKLLVASKSLLLYLHDLAKYEVKDKSVSTIQVKTWKGEVDLADFIPPIQGALSASLLPGVSSRSKDFFPRHVPRMRIFASDVQVMSSKARPKKIKVFVVSADSNVRKQKDLNRLESCADDIGEIHFLVKQEAKGDLRKDARVQDLNNVINRIMLSRSNSKGAARQRRRLHLRTFAVTCLSEETGLLEWVPNTDSFRNLLSKTYNPQASPFSSRRRGKRVTAFTDPQLRDNFENKCQPIYFKSGNITRAAKLFEELCLKPYPPLFFWWFVQNFRDPHAWYESRINFTLSAAVWSAVGHVIGLGDRHSENILIDTTNAECVHVDFDCIFDKGLHLPKPEVIPFRLTQNMIDAFGPTGADGLFKENLKVAMDTLRYNRDTLLSVLEPFTKDPIIDWKRYRSQQQRASSGKSSTTQDRQAKEVKRSINVIDERLRGIYNITNPNHSRIRRTDGAADQQEEELSHLLPLSVEGQVHKMIAEATSHENMVQLYVGWMPWV